MEQINADLVIVAAGKGSRMVSHLPKALIPIDNETQESVVLRLIRQSHARFKNIYVVASVDRYLEWYKFRTECDKLGYNNVTVTFVKSGLGTGHALLQAFKMLAKSFVHLTERDLVVCWGDVVIPQEELFDEIIVKMKFAELLSDRQLLGAFLPVKLESNPYVTVLTDGNGTAIGVDSSKLGETHATGYHDMSIFVFSGKQLYEALSTLHCAFWKNGGYTTPDGELHLTQTFHYLYNLAERTGAFHGVKVYESVYDTFSFNTQEELDEILALLKEEK